MSRIHRPEKGSPEYNAAVRPYIITLWHGEAIHLNAWDKSEANGIAAQMLLKAGKAHDFNGARRLIKNTKVAEKKRTRAPRGTHSRPMW